MKLERVSAALTLLSLACVLLIVALGLREARTLRARDAEMSALLALHETVALVSNEAGSLETRARPAEDIGALSGDLTEMRGDFARWAATSPPAEWALTATDRLLAELDTIHRALLQPRSGGDPPVLTRQQGDQVRDATYTWTLAVNRVLHDRHRADAGAAAASIRFLLALGLLLGVVAVIGFQLLLRRGLRPLGALARVTDTMRDEAPTALAEATAKHPIGDLGAPLNGMLDPQRSYAHGSIEEQVLREARIHLLAESQRIGRIGSWASASSTDRITWSEETYRITGTDPTSYIPTLPAFYDLVHPGDRDRLRRTLELTPHPDGGSFQSELRIQRPDGQLRKVLLRVETHRDRAHNVTHLTGTLQDVTEELSLRSRVDEQRRLLDLAADTAHFVGWAFDAATKAITWSTNAAAIYRPPTDALPTLENVLLLVSPQHHDAVRAAVRDALEEASPFDIEIQIASTDGGARWVRASGRPIRSGEGAVVGLQGALQDIDALKRLEIRTAASAGRLQDSLDQVTDGYLTLDEDLNVTFMNQAARRWAQHPHGVDPLSVQDALPTLFRDDGLNFLRKALQTDGPTTTRLREPTLDAWLEARANRTEGGLVVTLRDITEAQSLLQRLTARDQELRLANQGLNRALGASRTVINSLPANVAVLDRAGIIVDVNEQWRAFGAANGNKDPHYGVGSNYLAVCERAAVNEPDAMAVKRGILDLLNDSADTFVHEYPCPGPVRTRWFRLQANRSEFQGSSDISAIVMHIDISEQVEARHWLARLAYVDALTGLANRDGFVREFDERIRAHGWPERCVLLFLDIDDFRSVNDAHGFSSGDTVLTAVAARLQSQLGPETILGRMDGDTFAAFLRSDQWNDDADGSCARLMESLASEPYLLHSTSVRLSFHAGITSLGDRDRPTAELLREAQLALYNTDRDPLIRFDHFTEDLDRRLHDRTKLTHELRTALENNEFQLHYQPKVDLNTGALDAAEALLRWNHPERGLLSPGAFIDVAEKSGLITPIGTWVLNEACRALRRWQDAGLGIVRIAVNASVEQFRTGQFGAEVQRAIEHHGIAPAHLTIEITESVFVTNTSILKAQLDQLHRLGVQLALDDFGKGYSSLSYLKDFRFDYLKIDYLFVKDMLHNHYSRTVVQASLQLAESLSAIPIAEGIESKEQVEELIALKCPFGQGFYFGIPLQEEDFRWLLEQHATLPLAALP